MRGRALQWLVTLAVLWSLLVGMIFSLRAWTDDQAIRVVLLPGCVFAWGCVVLMVTGLLRQTELIVMVRQTRAHAKEDAYWTDTTDG
jgi:hypothetical protein